MLQAARQALSSNMPRKALALFLNVLADTPELAPSLEPELLAALQASAEPFLSQSGGHEAVKFLYRGAASALPKSADLAAAEGAVLHRMGDHRAAMRAFQLALALEPGHSAAAESLESLRSFAAERWHFR